MVAAHPAAVGRRRLTRAAAGILSAAGTLIPTPTGEDQRLKIIPCFAALALLAGCNSAPGDNAEKTGSSPAAVADSGDRKSVV